MGTSLSVSVVTHAPVLPVLAETLETLGVALARAREEGGLATSEVSVVDNGPGTRWVEKLEELGRPLGARVLTGHGNLGYGAGHNRALLASRADYHLVLNPDVALAPQAVHEALRYMAEHPRTLILAPEARDPAGELLFLCKRYPSVLDLALRGFAPGWLKRRFRARLERFEMRDLPRAEPSTGVPILSGSFMFCRRAPIAGIGGFSEAFFLYFEDFDLSLRAASLGELAYVPAVRIVHRGGNAARKGPRHVARFARSAITFFNRHGWKWA
jgi:hypothetical protein